MIPQRPGESWMGRDASQHKPRLTIHSIINRLFARPVHLAASLLQLLREEFPDVSFWQGVINWAVMASKTKKIIIRAGQNIWPDTRFKVNYAAAKLWRLLRGIYWFYDGRVSPGAQATLLVSLIKDDLPELGIWIDWEKNFNGSHEGLKNVVAMMQEVERLLPGVQVGMYTGYYFFIENSNPIWNAAQYAYLAVRKLWLAFYAALEDVLIPKPWTFMTYWQKGTPPEGEEHGCQSEDIDMNEDMTGEVTPPEPEPEGDAMKGTVRVGFTLTVRDATGKDTGKRLKAGDVVYGEETNNRIYFDRIYRADQTIEEQPGNSAVRDATQEFMVLIPGTEPTPEPEPGLQPLKITVEGDGYETVVVELKPIT